jgi:D-serine deaminase-like pyridoxal phosphate-dependent protein
MKRSRREWFRVGFHAAVAPTIMTAQASAYDIQEIEAKLARGAGIAGVTKNDLPTPCLLLDLDAFEANIQRMAAHAADAGLDLRPHAKTHKCAEIARRQVGAGALGVCVATIREAEAMAAAGIGGLLLTSESAGLNKIHRLIRLCRRKPDTMAVVDHPSNAEELDGAAGAAGLRLNVLVDVDPLGRRTGIPPGPGAVALAETVDRLANLRLRGVHGYCGASSHVKGFDERKRHSEQYMRPVLESHAAMRAKGLPVEIMSGASTGTYNIDSALAGMTELQVGSYALMDVDYRVIGGRSGDVYDDFGNALHVLATVISKNHDDIATVDAGLKAFATDRSFGPDVARPAGLTYAFRGDEHGALTLADSEREIVLGDKIELVVPHCDPNVNLYDRIYCVRDDYVQQVWKIDARGHV